MPGYADDIIRIIREFHDHPTAQDIFQHLKDQGSRISQASVYNNLNALCARKQLMRVVTEGMPDRYDVPDKHDHIMCPNCGNLIDIKLEDLTTRIETELGVHIEGYDLRALIICDECKATLQAE